MALWVETQLLHVLDNPPPVECYSLSGMSFAARVGGRHAEPRGDPEDKDIWTRFSAGHLRFVCVLKPASCLVTRASLVTARDHGWAFGREAAAPGGLGGGEGNSVTSEERGFGDAIYEPQCNRV